MPTLQNHCDAWAFCFSIFHEKIKRLTALRWLVVVGERRSLAVKLAGPSLARRVWQTAALQRSLGGSAAILVAQPRPKTAFLVLGVLGVLRDFWHVSPI